MLTNHMYLIYMYKQDSAMNKLQWGASGVMVIVVGNGHGDTSSNPGHSTSTFGKGMNPIILPPALGK